MITRYSGGMFMRINNTDEQKYMPMICANTNTMIFEDLLDDIL